MVYYTTKGYIRSLYVSTCWLGCCGDYLVNGALLYSSRYAQLAIVTLWNLRIQNRGYNGTRPATQWLVGSVWELINGWALRKDVICVLYGIGFLWRRKRSILTTVINPGTVFRPCLKSWIHTTEELAGCLKPLWYVLTEWWSDSAYACISPKGMVA